MRSSFTALVLATVTIVQVTAGPVKHGHAHFHAKKDAEALDVAAEVKRDVDWAAVDFGAVDYSGVDWSTIDYSYSEGQIWADPTALPQPPVEPPPPATTTTPPAPVVTPTTTPVAAAPVVTPTTTTSAAAAPAVTVAEAAVVPPPAPSPSPTTTPVAAAPAAPAASPTTSIAATIASTIESAVTLVDSDLSKLLSLGVVSAGVNSNSGGDVWIGSDGPYTNEFTNDSGEDIILVIWGPQGSWVNAVQPAITVTLPQGQSKTISFSDGVSGAWAAIYEDTELINGQISNTWGEFTFSVEGVVDVSREVNMSGHTMEIVGPSCTTNMDTCVFVCSSGNSCEFGYELLNCDNGSQPGANYGTFAGAPSGGCGGLGSSAAVTTTFS